MYGVTNAASQLQERMALCFRLLEDMAASEQLEHHLQRRSASCCRLYVWPANLACTPLDVWPDTVWDEFLHQLAVKRLESVLASALATKHLKVGQRCFQLA